MNRREFLTTAAVARAFGAAPPRPLEKGQRFNESVEFRDAVTAHPSRRLTTNRRWNQTPTYHQNACFARDSRRLLLTTEDEAGNSALLLADAETGDMFVIGTSADIKDALRRPNFNGNNVCISQAGDWAAASVGGSVRLWNLTTLKERVIYADAGEKVSLGHPIGSIDGKLVFFTLQHRAPEESPTDFMEADLTTGKVRVMHHEDRAACNHVVPNPVHPEILLIDRD